MATVIPDGGLAAHHVLNCRKNVGKCVAVSKKMSTFAAMLQNVGKVMSKKNHDERIPEKVSWRVVDAWLALPPCSYNYRPYCHVQCPYFHECYPEYYEDQ